MVNPLVASSTKCVPILRSTSLNFHFTQTFLNRENYGKYENANFPTKLTQLNLVSKAVISGIKTMCSQCPNCFTNEALLIHTI